MNTHADGRSMPRRLAALAVLLSLALAGCTFGRESESTGPDKSGYDGGDGYALAVTNTGEDAFEVTLRVLGVGNEELAVIVERVEPGETVEKWYTLQTPGIYSARLAYDWSETGRSASGSDERTFDSNACPVVTRIAWELRQADGQVGSAFLGQTCVGEEDNESA